jgi:hypothetical protein
MGRMAELKTKRTKASVAAFVAAIEDEGRRRDCKRLVALMKKVTKSEPAMWGPSIVGFGTYHYEYPSGREADWFLAGFSPRKQALTLYVMAGFTGYADLMQKLGKHKAGKSCLYVKSLDDLDLDVLEELVRRSVRHMRELSAK